MLIEKVTGKPYGEFLEEIFKPLDMMRTRTNDLHAIIPDRAKGYQWNGKELEERGVREPDPAVRRGHARLDVERPRKVGCRPGEP